MGKSLSDMIKNRIDSDDFQGRYDSSVRKKILFISASIIVSALALFVNICLGAVDIPPLDLLRVFFHPIMPDIVKEPTMWYYSDFVFKGRMPRAIMVMLTGTALGIAGMIMQGLLRNPLVSPFTLGVSTAASFGAAMSILFGAMIFGELMASTATIGGITFYFDDLITILFAFIASMVSISIVLLLTIGREVSRSMVILSGVVISYLFQAGIMASKYFSDDDQLREITLWIMGNFTSSTWGAVILLTPIVIICSVSLFKMSMDINALSAGDDIASSLGVDVSKMRKKGLAVSTLMTAACLGFTGVIGFVGLMAPHICRMIIGNDARYLLPASAALGVAILSISDLFCRMIIRPGELPVSIVLYIIGGLFFIWMISQKKWNSKL